MYFLGFPINPDEIGDNFEADIVLQNNIVNSRISAFNRHWKWDNGIIPYEMPEGQHSEWKITKSVGFGSSNRTKILRILR